MFKKYIFELVVVFFVRQVAKYLESFEFELYRKDVELRIRDLIPGTAFDEIGVSFFNTLMDGLVFLITNAELSGVIEAIKNNDLMLAMELVKTSLKNYIGV